MIFTDEEFARLAQHEQQLDRLVHSHYLSAAFPRVELEALQTIHVRVSGHRYPINGACGRCIASFLNTMGTWYFKDKDERQAAKARVDVPDKASRLAPAEGQKAAVSAPLSKKTDKDTGKVFKVRKSKNSKK